MLARVYFSGGLHATRWNEFRRWGPTSSRFDHHLPDAKGQARLQQRSVLYCAVDGTTCLAEVFQQTRRIDRVRDAPWLAVFDLRQPLRLLDLSATYATRVGASMVINTSSRVRACEWGSTLPRSLR